MTVPTPGAEVSKGALLLRSNVDLVRDPDLRCTCNCHYQGECLGCWCGKPVDDPQAEVKVEAEVEAPAPKKRAK